LNSVLERAVEPGARISGRPRGWRLAGTMAHPPRDQLLAGLRGELGIQLDSLDVFGMRLGETAVVLRAEDGRLHIAPIDATLNEGILHLEPELVRDDRGSIQIKLGPSSTLENALVNDEVSERVLSYAAPVLNGATRVEGRVSVKRLSAEFPLIGNAGAPARVEGEVLFDDVRFLPGPFADSLLRIVPSERTPALTLRDPISFRIHDRKVYEEGLKLPLGRVGSFTLQGSVDFDRNLDLLARLAPNAPSADKPVLASLLRSARFELPIRGTLKNPKIDAEAMNVRLKSLGEDMIESSVVAGIQGLGRLLERLPIRRDARKPPADSQEDRQPQGAMPKTAEERQRVREQRRLERLEKKAERRARRGLPRD
jgi:translocation and assembly module TamB